MHVLLVLPVLGFGVYIYAEFTVNSDQVVYTSAFKLHLNQISYVYLVSIIM